MILTFLGFTGCTKLLTNDWVVRRLAISQADSYFALDSKQEEQFTELFNKHWPELKKGPLSQVKTQLLSSANDLERLDFKDSISVEKFLNENRNKLESQLKEVKFFLIPSVQEFFGQLNEKNWQSFELKYNSRTAEIVAEEEKKEDRFEKSFKTFVGSVTPEQKIILQKAKAERLKAGLRSERRADQWQFFKNKKVQLADSAELVRLWAIEGQSWMSAEQKALQEKREALTLQLLKDLAPTISKKQKDLILLELRAMIVLIPVS
jgi:hypothetical protein